MLRAAMIRSLALTSVVILTFGAGDLAAFEFITGRGTGLGQAVILSRSAASVLVSVPNDGIADRELKLELGVNRKFELKDLDQAYIAAVYRRHGFTYTLGLSQFGYRDLYSERTVKIGAAWHFNRLTVGTNVSAMLVYFGGGYERLSAATLGGGLSYRTKRIIGAVAVDNLTSPRLDPNSKAVNPKYAAYLEIIGEGTYSVVGRMTLEKSERPQFAIGQKIDVSSYGSLFWGLSTAPLQYGGGFEVIIRKSHITYSTSYHPVLGFSHTVSVSYHFQIASGGKKGKS
jgi:hypothetical protein